MKILFLLLILAIPTLTCAETISWLGPIEIISEKFKKDGGVLGFTHSLEQGDCCCGGPSTHDSYPQSLHVDEKGNIVLSGFDGGGQILVYAPEGKKIGEIIRTPRQEIQNATRGGIYGLEWF